MLPSLSAAALTMVSAVGGGLFHVDAKESDVVAQLYKAGLASAFAHNHVVDAPQIEGFAVVDPSQRTLSDVRVTVDASALIADPPALRRAYGLDKDVSASDRQEIQAAMEGPGQLDVDRYPDIIFVADQVERKEEGRYVARGELTLHGVSKKMTVPLEVDWAADQVRVKAELEIEQTDFGIEPYSAVLGAVRNQDRVTLHIDLTLRPPTPRRSPPDENGEPGEPT